MSIVSQIVLSFSMSADAFAVSLGKGTCFKKPRLMDAMRTGAMFGGIEACAPVVGWLLGSLASGFVQQVDHWVAFGILSLVGGKMLLEAVRGEGEDEGCCDNMSAKPSLRVMVLTAMGTSIDSLAVGVSLAFMDAHILLTALGIGAATFTMSTLGLMIGHLIGTKLGRWAEALGGIGLVGIGVKILYQHLG